MQENLTDKALLDLAAKANGLSSDTSTWSDFDWDVYGWNPLTDDGDALRLAVKLKIPTQFPDWADVARAWGPKHGDPYDEFFGADPCAAVRRAIVRAAAQMA